MEAQDPRVLGSGLNSADRNLRHQTSFVPADLPFKVPAWPLSPSVCEGAAFSPEAVAVCQLPLGEPRKVKGIRNHEKLHSPEDFKINK